MKTRLGFVSNSSSSSFIIKLEDITPKQLKQIKSHILVARKLGMGFCREEDAWDVKTSEETWDELMNAFKSDLEMPDVPATVSGFTWMDNFDMREFLEKIGVPNKVIIWDSENN